jgi:hypothetical protein
VVIDEVVGNVVTVGVVLTIETTVGVFRIVVNNIAVVVIYIVEVVTVDLTYGTSVTGITGSSV